MKPKGVNLAIIFIRGKLLISVESITGGFRFRLLMQWQLLVSR
jgi:hypothetical protein